jgi:hypothetical protein
MHHTHNCTHSQGRRRNLIYTGVFEAARYPAKGIVTAWPGPEARCAQRTPRTSGRGRIRHPRRYLSVSLYLGLLSNTAGHPFGPACVLK